MTDQLQKFVGGPAAALLDHFGLGLGDLMLFDEPPTVLTSFAFQIGDDSKRNWVRVYLPISKELFSAQLCWPIEVIRQASIIAIREGQDPLCRRAPLESVPSAQ